MEEQTGPRETSSKLKNSCTSKQSGAKLLKALGICSPLVHSFIELRKLQTPEQNEYEIPQYCFCRLQKIRRLKDKQKYLQAQGR